MFRWGDFVVPRRVVGRVGAGALAEVTAGASDGAVGLSAGTVAEVPLGMFIGQHVGWRWTVGLMVAIVVLSMLAVAARTQPRPDIGVGASSRPGPPTSPRWRSR